MRKQGLIPRLFCLGAFLSGLPLVADGLAELKQLIGDLSMKIEHKTELTEAKDTKPPFQSESWMFGGTNGIIIRYNHYLNQPPQFTGTYPSLPTGDYGVGFDGDAFGNWYRGNAIRVLINGVDIMAQKPARRIETEEGVNGTLRMAWDLDKGGELVLNFTVPEDGRAIYARVEIVPGELPVKGIMLQLSCFPGGYNPAYNLPSHRAVATAHGEWNIPRDFKVTPANPWPEVPFGQGDDWIFYQDKLQISGSLGLLVRKEENLSGKVRMSNYGQVADLNYPVETRQIHLAFYAFDIENQPARESFLASLDRERAIMKAIQDRPGADQGAPGKP